LNILVIGEGAREHSICWAIKKSKNCKKLFCIPGNAGISEIAICHCIDLKNKRTLLSFCRKQKINLVIIGPENLLEDGLSDYLTSKNINVFGPSKNAAKLETSKIFAKKFLKKNNIKTAKFKAFRSIELAQKSLQTVSYPVVLKADGLASGKGVLICKNKLEAENGLTLLMKKRKFGDAGKQVIIEEYLEGFEISYFVFFDKNSFLKLGYALDHKRAFDNDKGPNTGGMGCFTPTYKITKKIEMQITEKIVKPTFVGLKNQKILYRGILFFGLMINKHGPHVIEYNVRFGDPECQVLMRNLRTDLLKVILFNLKDKLSKVKIHNDKKSTVCVVLASKGYPDSFKKGLIIKNLDKAQALDGIEIFHAGTSTINHKIVSAGGRVLSVTSKAKDIKSARKIAYKALKIIGWDMGFFRKDIGIKNI
tara:strand:- start:272 stop:1537 length:1266 start_codon:yes stop_codon:yes gene_type:complete